MGLFGSSLCSPLFTVAQQALFLIILKCKCWHMISQSTHRKPATMSKRALLYCSKSCIDIIQVPFFTDDYNRVVLEMEEGVPDSDYINASYVDVSSVLLQMHFLLVLKWCCFLFIELGSTQSIYCDSRTDRNDHWRLLENGLAGKSLMHSHGDQNFRLH